VDWPRDPSLYPSHMQARIRRGRGFGTGAAYKPWLDVRGVPSRGTSSNIKSIINGRDLHLLSERETILYMLIERRPKVVDIWEQWPILDLARTVELAAEFGARHTNDDGRLEPFTIDFMVTEQVGSGLVVHAESVKTPEDAARESVQRRLHVESAWCEENGIEWTLINTEKFNKQLLSNLRFIRGWFRNRMAETDRAGPLVSRFTDTFLSRYDRTLMLSELIAGTASSLRMARSRATDLFLYCAWVDSIKIDIRAALSLDSPLALRG